jgi:hypothetical protein
MGVFFCWWVYPQEHKELKYEVAVHAQIIPMFAIDSLGNPIFDLKKEDLELWVNGNPYPVYLLTLHRFEYQEGSQRDQGTDKSRVSTVPRVTPTPRKIAPTSMPKRVIFFIIDIQHQHLESLNRAKKITEQLIRESSPGDQFVLLSYSEGHGLKYLGGIDQDKETLIQKLKQLKCALVEPYGGIKTSLGRKNYLDCFSKLRYALMTISIPKSLFLISGEMSGGKLNFKDFVNTLKIVSPPDFSSPFDEFTFYEDISRAINQGGTPINVIYSGSFVNILDQFALKTIAGLSGGMFYYQPEVDQIVKTIKKTTSAYYEVVFIPKDKKIKIFNIDVKSKRKNVTLHAVKFSKQKKTYALMKSLQKKVFAMDVATGGYWSRTAAEVRKANYSTISSGKTRNRKEKYWKIRVDIPKEIRNKVAEIFLVRFDEGYQDAEIEIYKRVIRREQTLTLQTHDDKKLVYFVMVEPKSAYSIYNRVE